MNQDMDNLTRKSMRRNAGLNKSLSADFYWPERFGRGIGGMVNPENNGGHASERKGTSEKIVNLPGSTISSKSHVSVTVLQKKLNYETERKRQEIEMEKSKLENQLKLLQLEHELQEAEIQSLGAGNSRSSEVEAEGDKSRVQEWVNKTKAEILPNDFTDEDQGKYTQDESIPCVKATCPGEQNLNFFQPDELRGNESNTRQVNAGVIGSTPSNSNDIQILCQTIGKLLKQTNPSETFHNKLLSRQIVDKNFPIFYGNPEEWPLFFEQFERVSKMCAFSQEEIMVKLRKCLRGEAKSAVSGMMLASENVPLVLETLKMRFGRPDVIIEVLISKVNGIPYMKDINIEKLILFSNEIRNLVETMKSLLFILGLFI